MLLPRGRRKKREWMWTFDGERARGEDPRLGNDDKKMHAKTIIYSLLLGGYDDEEEERIWINDSDNRNTQSRRNKSCLLWFESIQSSIICELATNVEVCK